MIKLVMLGDGGVGKTALVIQLCLHKFVETYDPTIEDSYRKQVILDDQSTSLEVMDTAGQDEFDSLRDMWIRDGEGFFLVYSITQRMSFARVKQYFSEIVSIKDGEPFGAILVGNKIDQNSQRQVLAEEGQALADEWGIPFFETSAKMDINTDTAFRTLARATRDKCDEREATALSGDSNVNSFDTAQTSDALDTRENHKPSNELSPSYPLQNPQQPSLLSPQPPQQQPPRASLSSDSQSGTQSGTQSRSHSQDRPNVQQSPSQPIPSQPQSNDGQPEHPNHLSTPAERPIPKETPRSVDPTGKSAGSKKKGKADRKSDKKKKHSKCCIM